VSNDRDELDWRGTRTWTPADATAALPLVRRIVDDLVVGYRRWHDTVDAFEYATSGTRADAPNADADRLMAEAQALAAEIDQFRAELARLDIRVTRVDHGLIAFRGERGGEVVPLLWAPGMPAPSYDWPESVPAYGTSISWPSRAQLVAGKRSRA
jgi:hypothetical protein